MYHSAFASTLVPIVGASAAVRTAFAPFSRLSVVRSLTLDAASASTMIGELRAAHAAGGVRLLWRGNTLNVLKHALYTASSLFLYEAMLRRLRYHDCDAWMGVAGVKVVAGAMTGLLSTALSFPIDVMRTRVASSSRLSSQKGMASAGETVCKY